MPPMIRVCLALMFPILLAGRAAATDPSLEEKAWSTLVAGVNEKNYSKRHSATHALGLLTGDPKARALAEKGLSDHHPEVREAAATALGQMESYSSIPKLEGALNDKEVSVVIAAAHSLWVLKDARAYEIYYEILLGERKGAPGLIASQEEIFKDPKKLAKFGFEQGIAFNPYAGAGWEIFTMVRQDDVSPVRAAAARILADDPDPRSAQALVKACSDKKWVVRAAAIEAIARRGGPDFLKDIEPNLTDEKDVVRYTAAAAVIKLSSTPAKTEPPAEKSSPNANPQTAEPTRVNKET